MNDLSIHRVARMALRTMNPLGIVARRWITADEYGRGPHERPIP